MTSFDALDDGAGPRSGRDSDLMQDVVRRWDANAMQRARELVNRIDPAYMDLVTIVIQAIGHSNISNCSRLLDVGCGVGFLSHELPALGYSVTGIDPAPVSIGLARSLRTDTGPHKPRFVCSSLESFGLSATEPPFNVLVANMTMQSTPDLRSFLGAARRVIVDTGRFVATIPNPSRYLIGRLGREISDSNLALEQTYEVDFRLHGRPSHPVRVLHFHRPLSTYLTALGVAGFEIDYIREPEQVGLGRHRDLIVLCCTAA
jgi:2-polyprenyl-3-methyl-5-hydroxy-6-metoxy-1,4-benzoquinol methylase